jgi:geranylgeranyl diphosphate synthase type I
VRSYSPTMPELRTAVEDDLHAFLGVRRRVVPEAIELMDEIQRLIIAGGKRLRPAFCYWGYRCAGPPHCAEIVRAAASLELLHTFAIVHDDIMDDADERRGEPTAHIRGGIGFALLVGDLALVLADELFFSAGFDSETAAKAFAAYSLMRQEVIAGQHLDIRNARRSEIDERQARRVAVLKSGRYSIEKPLVIGALLGGAPRGLVQGLSRFGDPLGEAFQLRDDLLGVFGNRTTIGKPIDSDIREGKRNVLYAATSRMLTDADRAFFLRRWGGENLTDDEIERLRLLIEKSGARCAVEAMLDERRSEATRALQSLPLTDGAHAALSDLIVQSTNRDV